MPKAEPHFDADALLREVHAQDIGLRISTNHPANFRQIMYKAAKRLGLRIFIYACPGAPNALLLLKKEPANITTEELAHAQNSG